jgi:glycine cleavage system H protein
VYPDDLKYTAEHEWVDASGGLDDENVRVGITDYAQDALGDIVYVSLPDVGEEVSAGSVVGELESTKSVSEIYAPITGTVIARNDELDGSPELINADPYGKGWILEIRPADPTDVDALLEADAYQAQLETGS